MTQCEIILRLVKGYGWLGIVMDKNGVEVYRTGTFYPDMLGCAKQVDDMVKELDKARRLD